MLRFAKRIIVGVLLLVTMSGLLAEGGIEKIDPSLHWLMTGDESTMGISGASGTPILIQTLETRIEPATGQRQFGALVKTTPFASRDCFDGLAIRADTGTVHILWVTSDGIRQLAENDEVIYVEASRLVKPMLDISIPLIGASAVQDLEPAVRGAGVIIGAVDTGIDYTHLDFRYDGDGNGSEESTRILEIWDQTDGGQDGTRYTREEIEQDLSLGLDGTQGIVRQRDLEGHGTHILGIAAGDGTSSRYGLTGVAPEAWIVAVKTTFYSGSILAGVEEVFRIAEEERLPAVVNLSLGGHEGPHDGTSLLEQGIAELIDRPGRSVVVSAGNEGNAGIHWNTSGLEGPEQFSAIMASSSTEICMWYSGDEEISLTVISPSGTTITVPLGKASGNQVTEDGILYVDHASSGPSPLNGDHEVYIRISDSVPGAIWDISISDGGCPIDAWIYGGDARLDPSSSDCTISEPGNAYNVITVGASVSRDRWLSVAGWQDYSLVYDTGSIPAYSSEGLTRDGRLKPDLIAPGTWIAAALSRDVSLRAEYLHYDGVHAYDSGTSMSAAHVSGAIALLLCVDSELQYGQIVELLTSTTSKDEKTGNTPSPLAGWGMLNISAAVAKLRVSNGEHPLPEQNSVSVTLDDPLVTHSARFQFTYPDEVRTAWLKVFDLTGRLVHDVSVIGQSSYVWDLTTLDSGFAPSGLYFCVLVTESGASQVQRMVIEN